MVANLTQQTLNLAPGVCLGGYNAMLDAATMSNVKVVVNCGTTQKFLDFLDSSQPIISSDVIVLNLDPYASCSDAAYKEFHSRFNRILQNYLAFFYSYNKDVQFFINSNFENGPLALDSPTMNGVPLKSLFNINRLMKLIKNVNGSAGFLLVSEGFGSQQHSSALLYSLAISYLMDNYNYNFEASYKFIQSLIPPCPIMSSSGSIFPAAPELLNAQYYDDVLLIDSLKKFYVENGKIKRTEAGVMTKNFRLKRSIDTVDTGPVFQPMKRMA